MFASFLEFFRGSLIFAETGDQFRADPALRNSDNAQRAGHKALAHGDGLANVHIARGLHSLSIDLDAARAASGGRQTSCLEKANGPEPLIQTFCC